MSYSPQESNPMYREQEMLDEFPRLETTETRKNFMTFLEPKLEAFMASFGPEDDIIDAREAPNGEGSYFRYQIAVDDKGMASTYDFEIAEILPLALMVNSTEWINIVDQINEHPSAQMAAEVRGRDYYMSSSTSPAEVRPEVFIARQYSFHMGRLPIKTMEAGYKIGNNWFGMHFANGKYPRAEYDIIPPDVEELMDLVDHDMTKGITTEDVEAVLATLVAHGLYEDVQYSDDGRIIIPDLSRQNPIY